MQMEGNNNEKIIYSKLSYIINGIFFESHNEIGRFANEKQVCDLIERKLKERSLRYEREKVLPLSFLGEMPGRNRIDFLIEDKIVLEIKCKRFLTREDYYQTKRYLVALNKKLAILVNFRDERLIPKRILNSNGKI